MPPGRNEAASRLTSLTHTFADATLNTVSTFAYNAAGQIAGTTRSNDAYAYAGSANRDETVEINGLNQASTENGVFYYDTLGNAKDTGVAGVVYDAENRLVSAGNFRNPSAFLRYDPLGRLWSMTGSASGNVTFAPRQFLYDGDQIIAEYNYGTLTDRYAYGAGVDEPVLWDSGSALDCSGTKLLHADERGSVVASADCAGNGLGVNTYDENGVPGRANTGRFQYTGQAWLAPFGVYSYKARMYAPNLADGRFLQPDPIGYGDGLNWYGYVHGDPVNRTDPSGLGGETDPDIGPDIIVTGTRKIVITGPDHLTPTLPFVLFQSPGVGSVGTGQGIAPQSGTVRQNGCPAPGSGLVKPTPQMMTDATNAALKDVNGNAENGPTSSNLNSEFSRLNGLPNFNGGGWSKVYSEHSSNAYERMLPGGSGMAVKVYWNDRSQGGIDTIAIVAPTWSALHIIQQVPYFKGDPVNANNAADYMLDKKRC